MFVLLAVGAAGFVFLAVIAMVGALGTEAGRRGSA
jgi:hypothetical protein